MKRLSSSSQDFDVQLRSLTAWSETEDKAVRSAVDDIVEESIV